MKHIFTILLAIGLLFAACRAPELELGARESKFKNHQHAHHAVLVAQTANVTVYRITRVVRTNQPGSRYYYFKKGTLVKIDRGEGLAEEHINVQ